MSKFGREVVLKMQFRIKHLLVAAIFTALLTVAIHSFWHHCLFTLPTVSQLGQVVSKSSV